MVIALDSLQPALDVPSAKDVPDEDIDKPRSDVTLAKYGTLNLPAIVVGAATFHTVYNSTDHIKSDMPLRTVRLAMRYGATAFDTSAYYGPSEIVLGSALKALEHEFPRSSYQLMTKCGRYGLTSQEFDYSPNAIRKSVARSLTRLHTKYLDTVYLHDVEFVCAQRLPAGSHALALTSKSADYGLQAGDEGKVLGEGDQKVLEAIAELRKLKQEGVVKNVGITGYPLPVLLRLALLVLHRTGEPLDVLLSYSHLNLQNDTLAEYVPHFRDRARIKQLLTASPLNMGLLTPKPPAWHPAPPALQEGSSKAHAVCVADGWPTGIPNIALGFAYRTAEELELPTVVGLSNLDEVHQTMRILAELSSETKDLLLKRKAVEALSIDHMSTFQGWSWASPSFGQ